MADIFLEDWEGGIGTWTTNGSPAVNATGAIFGALGLDINLAGTSEYVQKGLPASCQMIVGRVYFDVTTPVAVNMLVEVATQCKIILNLDRSISAQISGGTVRTSAVLSTGPHYIDFRWTTSANPHTIDWRIDGGAAQTQATNAVAALTQTFFRMGMVGSVTGVMKYDQLRVTDVSGDYPIGPIHHYDPVGMMGVFGA